MTKLAQQLGKQVQLIAENEELTAGMNGEIPIWVEMPLAVVREITFCEPGIRGDTATAFRHGRYRGGGNAHSQEPYPLELTWLRRSSSKHRSARRGPPAGDRRSAGGYHGHVNRASGTRRAEDHDRCKRCYARSSFNIAE